MISVINPATGREERTFEEMSEAAVAEKITQAYTAHQQLAAMSFAARADCMRKAGKILYDRQEEFATLMSREMGKVRTQARAEVEKCAWNCLYYADHAERFLQDEFVATDAAKSYVHHEPLGVILAIMPWNFPFWQVIRFAAPALMAGNTALLKHASNVPGCALALEEIFRDAGFPQGAFSALLIPTESVESIIAHRLVRAVTLTGSTRAGAAVGAAAGKYLKKTVLELGGSDPYLILADADLELAAQVCTRSRMQNNGQSCIAAKRFIVVKEVYDDFLALLVEKMKAYEMGDPLDDTTQLGPLARTDLRDELHEQVQRSIELGAHCILGGKVPARPGAFYPPTILTEVRKDSPAYHEELFGPVASVIKAWDEEEAILIANDTDFGLGAAVFSRDTDRAERIAREQLRAGCVFVNGMVKSDPRLPFGGIKDSGYGRELSHQGIKEFVNIKTVYLA